MIAKIKAQFTNDGLRARALRGTLSSIMLAGGGNIIRFASNLILTRLLFPEAFGLMAIVQVVLTGFEMISNFGLQMSIMQNPRADERKFLNTAWTLQVIRGVVLWLIVCALSPAVAGFYNQPMLAQILPVAGFTLVIEGFYTVRRLTVQRHLQLGRLSILTLITQVINVIILSILAYTMGTVWALVIGSLISPAIALILFSRYLPGMRNWFLLDWSATREILNLGKYLFFSTIASYVINQSDRGVLGLFISIELLGIYGIAFSMATLAAGLAMKIASSVVFPLYRMRHPADSAENQIMLFRTRRLVAAAALTVTGMVAYLGPNLINLLYDDRYILAGPIIVLLSIAYVPLIVFNGLMNAALSKGDSLRFMLMNVANAICLLSLMYPLVQNFGIFGAAVAMGVTPLFTYPLLVIFLKRYKNWDPLGDLALLASGFGIMGGAVWLHWNLILPLMQKPL